MNYNKLADLGEKGTAKKAKQTKRNELPRRFIV